MQYTLRIPGRLPGINEYTKAQRTNRYAGATMKKNAQSKVEWCIRSQLRGVKIVSPVNITYLFYEPNRRRDHDNILGFAMKVIRDALVRQKVLKNDGWADIYGEAEWFDVDKDEPRIEVLIEEVDKIG